ncbi:aspartyl-phosphate phosphatase Spo0E family protein [Maledivibacter halophilus]|uniref:Spo0E like sporulation regulatory protein n=1 Tax=Maledivibacter halophilus TaxID=36842 RepID=A0A1T5KRM5_9FIRM|nr:aspartyl-phosphate phosphatase Spo0E family protein [Maledivibacter halophilus]SKC66337.1 Spo0E like sporulation regulatory protein [Maledivibacter halophilus]
MFEIKEILDKITYKGIEDDNFEELRLVLNRIYYEYGNVDEVVKISQELDKYISIKQKKSSKI